MRKEKLCGREEPETLKCLDRTKRVTGEETEERTGEETN